MEYCSVIPIVIKNNKPVRSDLSETETKNNFCLERSFCLLLEFLKYRRNKILTSTYLFNGKIYT